MQTNPPLDPEIAEALSFLREKVGKSEPIARGDFASYRLKGRGMMTYCLSQIPPSPDIETKTFFIPSKDGSKIRIRWYQKKENFSKAAVVFAHGGGMISGDLDRYDSIVSQYVSKTSVPFLSVQYRLAPEAQGMSLIEDVYAGLEWLLENASQFDLDQDRIAIMGESAGGGLAAGAAILARNSGLRLKKQILIYPMLDDRNIHPIRSIEPYLTWTHDHNFTGWSAYLGEHLGSDSLSPILAPSRLENFKGLPPAYIEVGSLDLFCKESTEYAAKLALASILTELHVHPGVPHGFERLAPEAQVSIRAMADRVRVIQSL